MKPSLRSSASRSLPVASGAAEMEQWLTHRTFWFVASVVSVVLLPYTIVWMLKQAWVIAGVTGAGLAAIAVCAVNVRRHAHANVNAYIWVILMVEFVAMALVAWLQGGSQAPALRWQAVVPCIAIAAGAFQLGLGMTVVFIIQVLVMHVYQPAYLPSFRAMVLPSPEFQGLLAVIVPLCLFTFFGWFTTKWRRRVLDALEQARREARQGEEVKERFLATISHEIRTPLNGVVGTLSLLRAGHLPPAQEQQLFDLMTQSSRSLLSMLNDVLDWSKLDAGQMQVEHREVNLLDLMEDCLDVFAVVAAEKGLPLTCSHDADVPVVALTDGPRLRQILHNLLGNAVKFTTAGSVHLHLSVAPASTADASQVWLNAAVTDTGMGIPAQKQAQLFQPFVQGDQSITREYGGTGLGLAISRELARLLGGDIAVQSQPGQGSVFTLSWPAGPVETDSSAHLAPIAAGPLLVLTAHPLLLAHVRACAQDLGSVAYGAHDVLDSPALSTQDWDRATWLVDEKCAPDAAWLARIGSRPAMVLADIGSQGPDPWPVHWPRLYKPLKRAQLQQVVSGQPWKAAGSVSLAAQAPWRAVVADDNATNQLILSEMLGLLGLTVETVDTGAQAVQAWRTQEVDVLLIDYQMPDLDGLSAVAVIRADEQAQGRPRLPIVLVSGDATLRSVEEWRQCGVDHVLSKPIEFADLQRLMRQLQGVAT